MYIAYVRYIDSSKISVLPVSLLATFKNKWLTCASPEYIGISLPVYIISVKVCDLDLDGGGAPGLGSDR